MPPVPGRNTFESAYAGQSPWEIVRPQKAILPAANRITGSVLDAGYRRGSTPDNRLNSLDETTLPQIARRARGTPRLALRLLQACRRVCRAEGHTALTAGHFIRACALEGIDDLGLGPTEQQYLALVAEGTSRLNVIASRLGLPSRTVSHVVEPFLLRAGLVVKDDGSRRELTALGRERLAALRQHLA